MSDMLISRDLFTARVNSTMMSINERFTYLQKKARPAQASVLTIRAKNSAQQMASAKNRRLAMQMEKRLSAMAALKLKKKSIRQRLGIRNNAVSTNVRDRLTLPQKGKVVRGRRLRRNRGRGLQRSQSMQSVQGGTLKRTASMQSLNKSAPRRARSRSRSRARTPAARSRPNSVNRQQQQQQPPKRTPSVNRAGLKGNFGRPKRFTNSGAFSQGIRGSRRGRRNSFSARGQRSQGNKFGRNQRGGRMIQRGRENFKGTNLQGRRNQQLGGGRRGRGKGGRPVARGRLGRGGGGQTKVILPTKEELDKQLEQYMANTKSHLDREIDTYMKASGVNDM